MSFLMWLLIIISAAIIVGAMILISTFYKEDQIWRVLLSIIITITVLVIFSGAYFAGSHGLWWISIIFGIVTFFTVYHLLEPD